MFFEGIRSERQLMRHAADRLSVGWYLGYNLNEPLPEHSSLTRIRERYGLDVFRRFFDAIVEQCQQEKLVWGKELYIDSTQVNANADLDSLTPRFAVEAREAIQAHLATLFSEEESQQEHPTAAPEEASAPAPEATSIEAMTCTEPLALPITLSEAEQGQLASENAARHDWVAQEGQQQREVHGLYQRTSDFKVSTTDPDATPMRLKGGGTHLGYHTHYVVDGGKARVILQVLVTPSEVMDNQPMRDLLFRTRFRWKLHPRHVTGDTKHGTIENIKAIEDQGIRAYVPLPNWEERYEVWSASHFRYEAQADQYRCPQGQLLQRVGESIPTDVSSIALLLLSAMPAQSKGSVREVTRGVASIVMWERSISSGFVPISTLTLTRKLCANAKCGWNRCLRKPKIGMACAASACGCSGASIAKPGASRLAKISSGCSKSAGGDVARSQRRPSVPLFGAFCVVCLSPWWRRGGSWVDLYSFLNDQDAR